MTFKEWIFSTYPNPAIKGQWGVLHILTLIICAGLIIGITFLFKNKSEKDKKIVIGVFAGIILFFEIVVRVVNFLKLEVFTFDTIVNVILPQPWCAISCWCVIFCLIVNKKFFYNWTSFSALLCSMIFFSYPGRGYNNQYILFTNLYSIITHALILITPILLITLKFTDFKFKTIWKELIFLFSVFCYAFLEIYVFKCEADPLYFMPNNDIQTVAGLSYPWFLVGYILFISFYISLFYLINDRKNVKEFFLKFKKKKQ
ncbi:MAG: YwaF family protein [Clostridia bacterium]|nr:YwaF family protein [Clostridia bacterium]